MGDRNNDFVEEKSDQIFVADIAPKVDVEIVTVDLQQKRKRMQNFERTDIDN